MFPTLYNIKCKLAKRDYCNEDQVRFSLVTRILQKLGWDIWNPNECCFEYSVKKYTKNAENKDDNGRVDIALFISDQTDRFPEVYIETKAVGKLNADFSAYVKQLADYNHVDRSAISILTDGIIWKFYLSNGYGTFDQRLFNELNLIEDSEDYIFDIFKQVLSKDNYHKKAVELGEMMLSERKLITELSQVKEEAISISKKTGIGEYVIAEKLYKNKFNKDIDLQTVERLWDRKVATIRENYQQQQTIQTQPKSAVTFDNQEVDLSNFNPTGKKPKRAFIIDQWYDVKGWIEIKILLYNKLLEITEIKLDYNTRMSTNAKDFTRAVMLNNKMFTNSCLSAIAVLDQCKRVLELNNYDKNKSLKLLLK